MINPDRPQCDRCHDDLPEKQAAVIRLYWNSGGHAGTVYCDKCYAEEEAAGRIKAMQIPEFVTKKKRENY